jgi:PCI domain
VIRLGLSVQRTTHVLKQLNVNANEVEELLIDLILEGKIDGKIDQVNMRLELDKQCVPPCGSARVLSNFSTAKVLRGGDTQPSIDGQGHLVEFMGPLWGSHRRVTVETYQRPDGISLVIRLSCIGLFISHCPNCSLYYYQT